MAGAASIKMVKTIEWRGQTQEWSNRYHFTNGVPADDTKWGTLADAIQSAEKDCFNSYISWTEAVGYGPDSDVPVYSKAYSSHVGAGSISGDKQAAEVAAVGRFTTDKRSSKNHPVYLFKFFHGAICTSATALDHLENSQKSALDGYLAAWITGFSDGSVTHHICGPDSTLATGHSVDQYVSHRDFRR